MRQSQLTREMQLYSTGKNNQTKLLRKINIHLGSQTQLTFPLELLPRGAWREAALKQKPKLITGSDTGSSFHTLVFWFFFLFLASADNSSFFRWKYCCKLCYWKLISSDRYSTSFISAQH